jgi:hypothetical protein
MRVTEKGQSLAETRKTEIKNPGAKGFMPEIENKNENVDTKLKTVNEDALNLEYYLAKYQGLEVSDADLLDSPSGEYTETILIVEWFRPNWLEQPLLKFDFPSMGFVNYLEGVPPKKE